MRLNMDNNYTSLFPDGNADHDETYFKMRQQLSGLQNIGGMDFPFGQFQQQQTNNTFVGPNMLSSNHFELSQLPVFSGTNGQAMQNMQSQLGHRQMSNPNFAGINQNLSSVLPQGHNFLDSGVNVGNYSSNMMLQQLLLQQAQQDNSLFQSSCGGSGFGGDAFNASSFPQTQVSGDQIGFQPQSIERQLDMPAFDQQQCQPVLGLMTLQSLDASDFPVEKRRKTTKNKRDKNRPKQPLSAYNIFFKDQRAKMLLEIKGSEAEKQEGNPAGDELKSGRKRLRESSTGKIGFEKMAKTIARRWKEIGREELKTYESRAADDQKRYKAELAAYLEKKREEAVTDSASKVKKE
ncbi:hypothetical protein FisN_8Lh247 [Fistulifera solaris]|uniref:HMG box domain-containing protein n=1 Tax=Fistulifera solaris TaxID=1519565 RepID=A0A1Z5JN54_FISSO|nr:hypothetical protein FisN_8Lh247 [Fistulifera solaris]|eukprot:GAX15453.1 hypothetical protein FisN_8Lh247 [Fistulifera solaris]